MKAMSIEQFATFLEKKGLHPVCRLEESGGIILIGETDWENDRPNEYPNGYYQTVYGLAGSATSGNMDIAQWLMFDAFHDMDKGWTQEEKRQQRVKATIEVAKKVLQVNVETRRYH